MYKALEPAVRKLCGLEVQVHVLQTLGCIPAHVTMAHDSTCAGTEDTAAHAIGEAVTRQGSGRSSKGCSPDSAGKAGIRLHCVNSFEDGL